ncbi:MAG: peptidoglycan-binding protein [Gracilibacter sp. BRH_c7a]|nr:MAG: peptidoglycan-binding protein [Gracilibacter sp. BRH_c7a]
MPLCPQGTIPYKIKPGDNFAVLAKRYNTTVEAITAVNSEVNPDNPKIGQSICIPVRRSIVPCSPGNRYIVKAGDTFSKLASRYGITLNAIIQMNAGVDPSNLQVGQIICLPIRRRRTR